MPGLLGYAQGFVRSGKSSCFSNPSTRKSFGSSTFLFLRHKYRSSQTKVLRATCTLGDLAPVPASQKWVLRGFPRALTLRREAVDSMPLRRQIVAVERRQRDIHEIIDLA